MDARAEWAMAPDVRAWRREFRQAAGEAPQLTGSDYNYLLALSLGARPEVYEADGKMHWPSAAQDGMRTVSLKAPDHPTAWMETFQRATNVDPYEALGMGGPTQEAARAAFAKALRQSILMQMVGR